jgi:glycosyltransferase involved in cell wall biosynthesis
MSSPQILFLAAHLPVLGQHGGGMRMYHNLRILAEKCPVTLLSFYESERELQFLPALKKLGLSIQVIQRVPCRPNHWLKPQPHEHDEYASPKFGHAIQDLLHSQPFTAIQAEYLQMGQHVPSNFTGLKVLTEHEIHYANFYSSFKAEKRLRAKIRKAYDWLVQFNYEIRICRGFDRIACMTPEDAGQLAHYVPAHKIRAIPIGVDSDYFHPGTAEPGDRKSPHLVFVGNFRHPPNIEAVHYFIQQVFPQIRHVYPDAEFWVAGANGNRLELGKQPGVHVTGYVEDLRSVYSATTVFVAPILSGNGMRVKLLEACAMSLPIVSTPLAASGFGARDGEHLLLARDAAQFAERTLRLCGDENLCQQLGQNARLLIQSRYDWNVIGRQFLELVEAANE